MHRWHYRAAGKPSLRAPDDLVRFVSLVAADVAYYSSAESPEYNAKPITDHSLTQKSPLGDPVTAGLLPYAERNRPP